MHISDSSIPSPQSPDDSRLAPVAWAARLGAITDVALSLKLPISLASARGRLSAAQRAGLLTRSRPLPTVPALYSATAKGMKASGQHGLSACRITAFNASHLSACAFVAASIERRCPGQLLYGERELRRDERLHGPIASAPLRSAGGVRPHRPDLVLWPSRRSSSPTPAGISDPASSPSSARPPLPDRLPIAIEVELTLKSPRRLEEICRAWARCRLVCGVLYLAPPAVQQPLLQAIERAKASAQIALLPLDALAVPVS